MNRLLLPPSLALLLAVAAPFGIADDTKPGDSSAENPLTKSVSEITVKRPDAEGWSFVEKGGPLGDNVLLVKALDEASAQKTEKSETSFRGGYLTEFLAFLGKYEAIVLVTSLDRKSHHAVGSTIVDPGSKTQLMEAQLELLKKEAKAIKKANKNSAAPIGGMNGAQLTFVASMSDDREYEIVSYYVPAKQNTYVITFAYAPTVSKETKKQLDEVKKGIRFSR